MERSDLLGQNGKIFVDQGKALGKGAVTLVVGNPCNTNCLIALRAAGGGKFYAMTRLDENRGRALLAQKAGVGVEQVSHMTIWGNHSSTQVPDMLHAKIGGKEAYQVITDRKWGETAFVESVQKRGAMVIAARGKSSAASAAEAALGAMRALIFPTPKGEWFSMAVLSDKNPYGVSEGLIFSFPCRQNQGRVEIVPGLEWDPFLKNKIAISEKELLEERELIKQLLV
jgi:malate dehydrogenase